MGYLGVPPQSGFITTAKQRVTSSTNNYVDLDHSISSIADVIVFVNFVKQDTTNLTLTTSTRITLGGTLVSSDIVEIHYLGKAVNTQTPATGTVTNDMLAGSIANSKLATDPTNASNLASGTVPTARLGSGTASSSTFLRGDSSFASVPGIDAYWSASRNSGQSVSQNTATTILFNVVTTATGITSTLTSNGRITIGAGYAGWYVVTAINRYADDPTSGKEKMTIKWYDHSASSTETIGYAEMNTSGTYDTKVATGLKYLDVNDYVYVSVNQNNVSSANFIGGNGTAFYGFKIA